jgi:hypothetical protein
MLVSAGSAPAQAREDVLGTLALRVVNELDEAVAEGGTYPVGMLDPARLDLGGDDLLFERLGRRQLSISDGSLAGFDADRGATTDRGERTAKSSVPRPLMRCASFP